MDLPSDPEITYLLSAVIAKEPIPSKSLINNGLGNHDTYVSIFKKVNVLLGLKIEYFDGFRLRSRNNISVIRRDNH